MKPGYGKNMRYPIFLIQGSYLTGKSASLPQQHSRGDAPFLWGQTGHNALAENRPHVTEPLLKLFAGAVPDRNRLCEKKIGNPLIPVILIFIKLTGIAGM